MNITTTLPPPYSAVIFASRRSSGAVKWIERAFGAALIFSVCGWWRRGSKCGRK
jgi:hypothetical protein